MEVWIDNLKAWELITEYADDGLSDAEIAKKLYRSHGLVSMRSQKAYSPGAVYAIRTNGKPKRALCKYVGTKPGRKPVTVGGKTLNSINDLRAHAAAPASNDELMLELAKSVIEMNVASTAKMVLLRKIVQ